MVKSRVEISQNFVAFSEYMNFNQTYVYEKEWRPALKEIDLESPPVSVAEAPRTATDGEGLDSSMEEGLTSLPAAEAAEAAAAAADAAAAAFAAACEYPNTIGQIKFSSRHKNSNFKAFNLP